MPELTMHNLGIWIDEVCTGEFHYKEVMSGNLKPSAYPKLREYLGRYVKLGKIEPLGRRDGHYRPVQELPQPIDWQGINPKQDFPVILPFDLRRYVWIDFNSLIAVAGSKDSGKTGFLMRTIALNMNSLDFHTVFLTNMEGGEAQLKRRFEAMDIEIPNPAPFDTYHIVDNFHDAIKESNTLYIIDYIDVPESGEFFMIAPALAKAQVKLDNSVAIAGLHKRRNSDLPFGGEQTLKKVMLTLGMDNLGHHKGRLKIIQAKVHTNPTINPVNMQWTFTYANEGTSFSDIEPYYGEG